MKTLLTATLAVTLLASTAYAVDSNQAQGTASATVMAPISIAAVNELEFGTFSAGSGGTVTQSLDGQTTTGGGVVSLGTGTPGSFQVSGSPSTAFSVNGSDTSVSLGDSHGHTMSATLTYPSNNMLDNAGQNTLSVGGILNVGANQTPGGYVGHYNVIVNYN